MTDINIDYVREAIVIHVPDMLDDHRPAQGPARVPHHIFKDAEFFRRQVYDFACPGDASSHAVEDEISHLEFFGGWLTPAQENTNPRQQLSKGEWFYKVII